MNFLARGVRPPGRVCLLAGWCLLASLCLLAGCGSRATRVSHHLQRAQHYLDAGQLEKAQIEFRNAAQIEPRNVPARLLGARIAEQMGNLPEAAALYRSIVELDADARVARAGLGRLYVLAHLPRQALDVVQPALLRHPEDAPLLTVRGAARLELKDGAGAALDAEHAVRLAPEDENAVALLASVYQRSGQSVRAVQTVRTALARVPHSVELRRILVSLYTSGGQTMLAEEQLRQIVSLRPRELAARYQLALFLAGHKRLDDAERTLQDAVAAAPSQNAPKLALAGFLAENRSAAAAQAALEGFLRADAANQELRVALGLLQQRAGQPDAALASYRRVAAEAGDRANGLLAHERAAALLIDRQRFAEAAAELAPVLRNDPHDNDALLLSASLALQREDAAAAITDLRALLRDRPRSTPAMRLLARAYAESGKTALAEEQLRAALEVTPADVQPRLELADLLLREGRADAALEELQLAAKLAPADLRVGEALVRTALAKPDLAAARRGAEALERLAPQRALGPYMQGLVAQAEHHATDAARDFERALALQPDALDALTALVRVQLAEHQPQQAREVAEQFAQRYPASAAAQNLLGELYLQSGDLVRAAAQLERASQLAPQWSRPYLDLAAMQLRAGEGTAAEQTYKRGIAHAGRDTTLVVALAEFYEQHQRGEDAIREYEALYREQPRLEVANNLAMLLVTYRSDRASLDRALDLTTPFAESANAALLDTAGWVRFKRGELSQALPVLEQAAERAPRSGVILYHLGMAQLRAGNRDKARESLQVAVQAGQRYEGLDQARSALAGIASSKG
ncbi:MAG TPA: tetratricopeptide repeat protein [Steroidobacteraceae bacterium]|nr:tetratricopeptide repeat protein [Steroidobacteraceae bacterium]